MLARIGGRFALPLLLGALGPALASQPEDLRVLTWNTGTVNPRAVRLPEGLEDEVVELLAAERPHVAALQEVAGRAQVARLQAALRRRGLEYGVALAASDPRRDDGRTMAVLHQAPAEDERVLRSTVGEGFQALAVELPRVTIVGVHAPTSQDHREAFFPQLLDWVADLPGPVVVAGDLNLGPYRGAGRSLVLPWRWDDDQRLYERLAEALPVHTGASSTTVYRQAFDHVLADSGRLTHEEVLRGHRELPQDHEPLLVELALPARGASGGLTGAVRESAGE